MTWWQIVVHHPATIGALGGLLAAARQDRESFSAFKRWGDLKAFDWRLASFRYAKGLLTGALTGFGYSLVA
jgi:hypothetical protein